MAAWSKKSDKIRTRLLQKGIWATPSDIILCSSVDEILTDEVMSELILDYDYDNGGKTSLSHDDICQRVRKKGLKKIFAVLLVINAGHLILDFVSDTRFSGPSVPVTREDIERIMLREGAIEKRMLFDHDQWLFMAPILKEGQHGIYGERMPMPFLEDEALTS